MNFLENIGKKIGTKKDTQTQTEKIAQQRTDIKVELAAKLYQKGFSEDEVDIVLSIIETAENDIELIKKSLIGTNINPKGDPNKPLADGVEKIKQRQIEMQKELNETIAMFAKNHEH